MTYAGAMWAAVLSALAVVWLASACGAGAGAVSDDDAGRPMSTPRGTLEIGDACSEESQCAVAFPECVDLAGDGTARCESVCADQRDCSDNADCVALRSPDMGICLLPCQAHRDCRGRWLCLIDRSGIGYCQPSAVGGGDDAGVIADGLAINEPCTDPSACAATSAQCSDWGDGLPRCTAACERSADCGVGAMCLVVDTDTGDALCFTECQRQGDCPVDWICGEATDGGRKLCNPPG